MLLLQLFIPCCAPQKKNLCWNKIYYSFPAYVCKGVMMENATRWCEAKRNVCAFLFWAVMSTNIIIFIRGFIIDEKL